MPGDPHFSCDRSVPLAILYLLTKNKQILNIASWQKKCFDHHAVKNFNYRGDSEFAKKGFWMIISAEEGFLL